jgi:hypothetical protein
LLQAAKKWKPGELDEDNPIYILKIKPAGFVPDHLEWDDEADSAMPDGMAQEPATKSWQYKIVTKASACV